MPINIPSDLPARTALEQENIFVMTEARARSQDIRPLRIALVNLMPTKMATELHLLRLLGNSPLQVDICLLRPASHESKNTASDHLERFYQTFAHIEDQKFDGMIITGAPVEKLEFEEVDYWTELQEIMDYSTRNVFSTLYICWGAQAGLYHRFGIPKYMLPEKLSGVFPHHICLPGQNLLRGFDDVFHVPHSRYTEIRREDIEQHPDLDILCESPEAGVCVVAAPRSREIFITGHLEYDSDTLAQEYIRDTGKGLNPALPLHYFPQDDPSHRPFSSWRSHAHLFFSNWLNYYVYQETPYNVDAITGKSHHASIPAGS